MKTPMNLRWENITYVSAKSGRMADTDEGRFTVRRAAQGSRYFVVRLNNVLSKNTFSSIEEGMQHAEGWYENIKKGSQS